MKVKIYLGESATGMAPVLKQTVRYTLEFYGHPNQGTLFNVNVLKNVDTFLNLNKQFSVLYSTSFYTLRESTFTDTLNNLLSNFEEFNANENVTYSLSPTNNSYGYKDLYVDIVGLASDVFTLFISSNNTSAINFLAPYQLNTFISEEEVTYDDYKLLDLFDDENIEFTSKLSDIEKLSNVFTDFSNSFTVPATANNNEILKHYYDVDVDNTFNANIRVNGYIEIDSFPFRFGKIQLESVKLKNQKPDNYKITFYGGLLQLSELFGDDTINLLDYVDNVLTYDSLSKYDYEYNEENLILTLNNPSFKDGDVITPLIFLADRDINYDVINTTDIGTDEGAINDKELRPALRIKRIIEAIQVKYGITFTDNFFGGATFNNLFLWLNRNSNPKDFISNNNKINFPVWEELTIDGRVINYAELLEMFPSPLIGTNVYEIENNIQWAYDPLNIGANSDGWYNTGITPLIKRLIQVDVMNIGAIIKNNYIKLNNTTPYTRERVEVKYFINADNNNILYNVQLKDMNDNIIWEEKDISGNVITIPIATNKSAINSTIEQYRRIGYKLYIQSEKSDTYYISTDIKIYTDTYVNETITTSSLYEFGQIAIDGDDYGISTFNLRMQDQLPVLKVIDFFQGIMKQFKLVIRPIEPTIFYINTLDGYYSDGNILNITEYVDEKDINIERPLIYKNINFQYQKTNNILGAKFRKTNDITDTIGYGDLRAKYNISSKNTLDIQLPFENMLFERLNSSLSGLTTNIVIGQSSALNEATGLISVNASKPIMFFNNGIVNLNNSPIKLKWITDYTAFTSTYLVGNTNDELLDQVTDTINFGAEIDPWHLTVVANSLYLNYWSNWINTIYDLKQRKFTFEANLPPRYIEELSLNDRIIIGNNRYKINDYKINLLNGKTQFTLFNDIYDFNAYSFPAPSLFNEFTLSPSGFFNTDYIDADGSTILYGSFTGYNGTTVGRVVKILANGDIDTSFNSGTGFNLNSYATQSVLRQSNGKLLFTGDFTSYSGVSRNRIIRLESNGSIDTSLVVGTGFNDLTSAIGIDSNNKIIVGGSFTSYSGVSRNGIIRLTSGGTVDSSFVIGTGFNSVTNDVVINADDSMYVSGFFSAYSGVSSNRLVKLTSGGTVDSTFDIGAGLNSSTSEYVRLLSDGNDGVYVAGFFTTYSGITVNRITKLDSNGQINANFNSVSGFSTSIRTMYSVMTDKVLVAGSVFASNFGTYNGLSLKCGLVLNQDGSIYRTFDGVYKNIYANGSKFYGNLAGGATQLIADETLPTLSIDSITANAGVKYFSVNILKNEAWSVTKLDLGYDTDWVTLMSTEGTGVTEFVFRVEEKATQSAPTVYQPRYMDLLFNFGGVYRSVRIIQNGLTE